MKFAFLVSYKLQYFASLMHTPNLPLRFSHCLGFISCVTMTPFFSSLFFIFAILLLMQSQVKASACSDCFVQSRAAYYPNSDEQGTDRKRVQHKSNTFSWCLYQLTCHANRSFSFYCRR